MTCLTHPLARTRVCVCMCVTPLVVPLESHLELDQHALAAHASRAPQVVDVFVLLV